MFAAHSYEQVVVGRAANKSMGSEEAQNPSLRCVIVIESGCFVWSLPSLHPRHSIFYKNHTPSLLSSP